MKVISACTKMSSWIWARRARALEVPPAALHIRVSEDFDSSCCCVILNILDDFHWRILEPFGAFHFHAVPNKLAEPNKPRAFLKVRDFVLKLLNSVQGSLFVENLFHCFVPI